MSEGALGRRKLRTSKTCTSTVYKIDSNLKERCFASSTQPDFCDSENWRERNEILSHDHSVNKTERVLFLILDFTQ